MTFELIFNTSIPNIYQLPGAELHIRKGYKIYCWANIFTKIRNEWMEKLMVKIRNSYNIHSISLHSFQISLNFQYFLPVTISFIRGCI